LKKKRREKAEGKKKHLVRQSRTQEEEKKKKNWAQPKPQSGTEVRSKASNQGGYARASVIRAEHREGLTV